MRIVVLPGLDGTGLMLRQFAARMSELFATQVVTYPGDRVLSYPELADFVAERLPRDAHFVLVAESFAGPIATLLAARRTSGIAGLAYVASFVRRPFPAPRFLGVLTSVLPLKWRPAQALMHPLTFGRWTGQANLAEALSAVGHGVLAARLKAILRADYRDELAGLDLPLFYLRPSEDRLVQAAGVLEMARLNPALTVRAIEGPHFVLQTRATEAAAALAEFVTGVAS